MPLLLESQLPARVACRQHRHVVGILPLADKAYS